MSEEPEKKPTAWEVVMLIIEAVTAIATIIGIIKS